MAWTCLGAYPCRNSHIGKVLRCTRLVRALLASIDTSNEKERLLAAADLATKMHEEQLDPKKNTPVAFDPEQKIFVCRPCQLAQPWREF